MATATQEQSGNPALFRGGGAQTGVFDVSGVPKLGGIAWRFDIGAPIRSSPVLFDGAVYVGSSNHRLYAVDAEHGTERWNFAAETSIASAPAVDADRVVLTDRAGDVYALSRADGSLLWKVEAGPELPLPWGPEGWDYFTASPTLVGDLVLVGAGDGLVRALDAATGDERWSFDAAARIRATPAVADGRVFIGASDGMFYALDLADGSEVWRFTTAGHEFVSEEFGFDRQQIYPSAAVSDGVVYIGSRDAFLYALDAGDGSELWRSGDGSAAWVIGSPTPAGDRVYETRSSSTLVRALDAADGSEVWRVETGAGVFSSPVLANDTVHVGLGTGSVVALNAEDGALLWRYRTGGAVWGTPVVTDERMYIGSDDGYLYAFAATAGHSPRLAVYSPQELPFRAGVQADTQTRIQSYFEERAYEVLTDESIAAFMRQRIADDAASVVVFAVDHLPAEVVDESAAGGPLYRRYLAAGGKIVWMGMPPAYFVFDAASGQVTGVDESRTAAVLGVGLGDFRADSNPVVPTAAGESWGLESAWIGSGGFAEADVSEVLARDEFGRVAAFARNFGGPEGTGWVYLQASVDRHQLDEIRAVAEYGVMRTPPRQHP